MRRLGAILMIIGANMAVGSLALAFWRASFECAIAATDGGCAGGAVRQFIELLISADGLIFWTVIIVGLLVFWRGKRMRASS